MPLTALLVRLSNSYFPYCRSAIGDCDVAVVSADKLINNHAARFPIAHQWQPCDGYSCPELRTPVARMDSNYCYRLR